MGETPSAEIDLEVPEKPPLLAQIDWRPGPDDEFVVGVRKVRTRGEVDAAVGVNMALGWDKYRVRTTFG